ncbi:hypothetical protein QYF36_022450 [Acer negundo]|nr:hypothetical protein QYF36_022450 [Acer negundo]
MRKVEPHSPGGMYKNIAGQSFVEVVKDIMKEETMEWDERAYDNGWLEFSAMGVLISFSDIGMGYRIEDETSNISNLVRGKVLVFIPYMHICPQVISVATGRRSFSVSVWEDSKQISYSRILRWLGLDWEENDGDSIFGMKNYKKKMEGEGEGVAVKSATNHRSSRKVASDELKSIKYRKELCARAVEKFVGDCFGTVSKVNDQNKDLIGKGKGIISRNSNQPVKRPTVCKDVLLLKNENGDGWTSSSGESEEGNSRISP